MALPLPQFVIFYNGVLPQPDYQILKLSELYEVKTEEIRLELEAVMLNVNRNHNPRLMEACQDLKDYAEYVDRVRKYAREQKLEDAVEQAIRECIQEGILKEFLEKNRAEAKKVSLYEYDYEEHMRVLREECIEEGIEKGIARGEEAQLSRMIEKKLRKGKNLSQIAEELEEEEERIQELIEKNHLW